MLKLDAKKALARKLDIDYADIANNDLFTDDDLDEYLATACYLAWDYEVWDWSEHSKTATLAAGDITNGYVAHPNDIAPSSIYYLELAGNEQYKKLHSSFKRHFQQDPTSTKRYWAEFKRLIFFNANIAVAGDIMNIYGKKNLDIPTDDADLMPFSPDVDAQGFSGNDAIVILAYSLALSSEKKKNPNQAKIEETRAYGILKILSDQLKKGRASEQPTGTPMFNVPDYFSRNNRSNNGNNIGRFDQNR